MDKAFFDKGFSDNFVYCDIKYWDIGEYRIYIHDRVSNPFTYDHYVQSRELNFDLCIIKCEFPYYVNKDLYSGIGLRCGFNNLCSKADIDYNIGVLMEKAGTVSTIKENKVKEKPCIHPGCRKMNDVGVDVCWNCGNNPG